MFTSAETNFWLDIKVSRVYQLANGRVFWVWSACEVDDTEAADTIWTSHLTIFRSYLAQLPLVAFLKINKFPVWWQMLCCRCMLYCSRSFDLISQKINREKKSIKRKYCKIKCVLILLAKSYCSYFYVKYACKSEATAYSSLRSHMLFLAAFLRLSIKMLFWIYLFIMLVTFPFIWFFYCYQEQIFSLMLLLICFSSVTL